MFKPASKPMSTFWVAWRENDEAIDEGKAKYFGERIVGKLMDQGRFLKGKTDCAKYTIKLYADFDDESKFGQEPDGEIVTVWGTKLIEDAFVYGTDGEGIQIGDIVEIVYKGWQEPVSAAGNGYHGFAVGSFRPTPSFKGAGVAAKAPTAAPAKTTASAAPAKPAAKPAAAPARVTQAPPVASKPTQSAAEDALDDLGY